jgi:hypothetical protein
MSRGLSKVPNWEERLMLWAEAKRREPWAWGETDCGNLAREALRIVYGCSVVQTFPLQYKSRAEAIRWLRELGQPLGQYLLDYGATVVPTADVQGGDIVLDYFIHLHGVPQIPSLAVAVNAESLLTSTPDLGPHWINAAAIDAASTAYRF